MNSTPLILPRPRRLWVPGDPPPFSPAPRRHRAPRQPRTFRDWMRSPFHAMGRLFGTNGWTFATGGGDFGASGAGCCRYAVRKCSDNSLTGEYLDKSDFPAFPSTFYFKDGSDTCVYAQASDTAPCDSTPLATVGTTYASCAACSGGGCGCCSAGGGTNSTAWIITFSGVSVSSCCTGGPGFYGASASVNGTYTLSGPCGGNYTTTITSPNPGAASSCTSPITAPYIITLTQYAAGGGGSGCAAGWSLRVMSGAAVSSSFTMFAAWLDGNGIWDTDCTQSRTFTNTVSQCSPSYSGTDGLFTECDGSYIRGTGSGGTAVVTPC